MNPEYIRICSIPAMQEKFRERMGEPKWGDLVIIPGKPEKALCPEDFHLHEFWKDTSKDWTFCPLPIDPLNPERGLWGMVDWTLIYTREIDQFGDLCINIIGGPYVEGPPELALLKALAYQLNVEVEG